MVLAKGSRVFVPSILGPTPDRKGGFIFLFVHLLLKLNLGSRPYFYDNTSAQAKMILERARGLTQSSNNICYDAALLPDWSPD